MKCPEFYWTGGGSGCDCGPKPWEQRAPSAGGARRASCPAAALVLLCLAPGRSPFSGVLFQTHTQPLNVLSGGGLHLLRIYQISRKKRRRHGRISIMGSIGRNCGGPSHPPPRPHSLIVQDWGWLLVWPRSWDLGMGYDCLGWNPSSAFYPMNNLGQIRTLQASILLSVGGSW